MAERLPIYKIGGKYYFRDARLGEYRNIKNPHDSINIDDVGVSKKNLGYKHYLQKMTRKDNKKIFEMGW